MKSGIIDTNVIVRFLVETPETIGNKFKGVFSFFEKIAKKQLCVELPELVIFETYFVLTSHYGIPSKITSEKLIEILSLSGVEMGNKSLIISCFETLKERNVDLVDAYIAAMCKQRGHAGVYSFDSDMKKLGLSSLEIK
ncbi:MAG: PIN domain-containing protein [Victivallales bacterium]